MRVRSRDDFVDTLTQHRETTSGKSRHSRGRAQSRQAESNLRNVVYYLIHAGPRALWHMTFPVAATLLTLAVADSPARQQGNTRHTL